MKTNTQKKNTKKTMSDETFAQLELSFKQALAYKKGQQEGLRVTKKAITLAPKQRLKP